MAEPIRPLSNEIPRRNPSADNAIGTEGGDIGGNRGTNSRTRGLRLEGKAKRGARFVRSAKTEQISTRWKRRSRIDFVVNWKSSCGFFFWRKVVVVVVVLYVKRWSVFLEYLILFFFFFCSFFFFSRFVFAGNQWKIENPRKEIGNFSLQGFLLRLVYILNWLIIIYLIGFLKFRIFRITYQHF